jgi:hypothetical protein
MNEQPDGSIGRVLAHTGWLIHQKSLLRDPIVSVPLPFGLTMIPEFLGIRGFIHFALFLISFYFGFIRK